MRANILGMVAMMLMVGSMSANAIPLIWNLQGVTFNDGGTATGSFGYDADTSTYSAINIQTTGNLSYTYTTAGLIGGGAFALAVATGSSVGDGFLQLTTLTGLTNAGGTVTIGPQGGLEPWETRYVLGAFGGVMFDFNSPPFRAITAGYVTSVPEPATFTLLCLGLLGVGFMWRRKTS